MIDELNAETNMGPNDLEEQGFQNHIIIENVELGLPLLSIPEEYSLHQNYPNPFNPKTLIKFSLPSHSSVEINVFDIRGKKITTLLNDEINAGDHNIIWNAKEQSSGVYFIIMESGNFVEDKKIMLLK